MTEIHWTDDGGVEFVGTDGDGNTRRIKFRPNDDGSFDVVVDPPAGDRSAVTIDPGGGNTALGK